MCCQIQIQKMTKVWSNFLVRFQKMTSFRIYSDFNSSTVQQMTKAKGKTKTFLLTLTSYGLMNTERTKLFTTIFSVLMDITPLEAFEMIEQYFKELSSHYVKPVGTI